jgi:hypothetical protein
MDSQDTCPICIRPGYDPYRVYDKLGKVLQGCVASFHDGRLVQISESNRWHNRPQAKAIRRSLRQAQFGK